ncbi:MAG: WYL domain-containing protein [Actinomycetota bacterium]|nr:WYL domain-containing protein [Actinomycetota bacterium]
MAAQRGEGRLGRRLRRILLLLPYAIQHPGVSIDELARKFGVKKKDLIDDLNLVFLCGLPGYGPGDLIEATIDEDRVYVRMADYFGAPFRLTPAEALTLYAGGRALAELPDMEAADSLKRALEKLARALGLSGDGDGSALDVRLETGSSEHLRALQRGVTENKELELDYFSATQGRLTNRTVRPWGLVAAVGRWYLVAWDNSVEDERMFRVDRIKNVALTDKTFAPPADFDPSRYRGAFVETGEEQKFSLEISPRAAKWFVDYYPIKSSARLSDGWLRVEMATSGTRWPALLLLRLGPDARKSGPGSVVEAATGLAESIAARHGCR